MKIKGGDFFRIGFKLITVLFLLCFLVVGCSDDEMDPLDVDNDGDGYTENRGDCNDNNFDINPGADEICGDGIDQDCNGADLSCSPNDIDNDGDGYTENQGDCNDNDPDIYPGAEEICEDGIDQDCNGVDKQCGPLDIDDDNDGYTENQGDCNDADDAIHPGAFDVCEDGVDQDCNGEDRACSHLDTDDDMDGFSEYQGDCNDNNFWIYPGAVETCGDGVDQDCDGEDLSCDPNAVDNDNDGYSENEGDCNDADPSISPVAYDTCGDGIDQNCDGQDADCNDVDNDGDGFSENQGDCNDDDSAIYPDAFDICEDGIDQNCDGIDRACGPADIDDDGDGFAESEGDCDDADPDIHPDAEEICGDGIDQNCDGEDPQCGPEDIDDDGDGFSENQGDCDDTNDEIHPGAEEFCGDGIDQNCNGSDVTCPPNDADMDQDGYTVNEGDCDDYDDTIHPEAEEICGDGIDQDCDGKDLGCFDVQWELFEFNAPESVAYDPGSNLIYVSNMNTYGDLATPDDGYISRVFSDGLIETEVWLGSPSGGGVLSDPRGLAIHNGMLYVADDHRLAVINLSSKTIAAEYVIGEDVVLNDVVVDTAGNVYVSDSNPSAFGTNYIYRLESGDSALVRWHRLSDGENTIRPDALYATSENLIVGTNNGIYSIRLQTKNSVAILGKEYNISGLWSDGNDGYYLADRYVISHFNTDEGTVEELHTYPDDNSQGKPGDLKYISDLDLIVTPNLKDGVTAYRYAATSIEKKTKTELQEMLNSQISLLGVPGASLYVDDPAQNKEWHIAAGLAARDNQTEMRANDYFRIGNITQTFTAAVIMMLADEKKIELADPIEKYLPGLIPRGNEIILYYLLTHHSGLSDPTGDTAFIENLIENPQTAYTPEALVQMAASKELLSDPGTAYHYSAINYVLLGMLVESVTDSTYAAEVQERILIPLDLNHTFIPVDETMPQGFSRGYTPELDDVTEIDPSYVWAAGNMISTTWDLARWAKALFGGEILKPYIQNEMMQFLNTGKDNTWTGRGVYRFDDIGAYGCKGNVLGYSSAMYYFPETGMTIVSMANTNDADAGIINEKALAVFGDEIDLEDELRQMLEQKVPDMDVPGAVLYVNDPQKGEYLISTGFARNNPLDDLQPRDKFRIGDLTIPVTAVIALQLYDEGRLDIDNTVNTYLPDEYPSMRTVRIRYLLNHTGALANAGGEDDFVREVVLNPYKKYTPREVIALSYDQGLLFQPGADWHYSVDGYKIVGLIIEAVSNSSYASIVQKRIFDALGMTHSLVPEDETIPGRHAHGYLNTEDSVILLDTTYIHPSWCWASGNIISTAKGLGRFLHALFVEKSLISETAMDEMMTLVSENAGGTGRQYGLGVEYFADIDAYGHQGSAPGYSAEMLYFPETDLIVVTLVNLSPTTPREITSETLNILGY